MPAANGESPLGYLWIEHEPAGAYLGGYLLVTPHGRPLEFHCTAPVEPTRAQEILFGATLDGYVKRDLIAVALLSKAKLRPQVLLVAEPALASVGEERELPVLLVDLETSALPPDAAEFADLGRHFELAEPFERIREAIREAQRLSTPGPAADVQAA